MFHYWILCFLLLLVTYYYYQRQKDYDSFWKYIYAIPGAPSVPIFGNTQGLGKNSEDLFYMICELAKTHTSIFRIWNFNIASVFLMEPDDIEILLSGMKHHTKGRFYEFLHKWLGTGLLTSTGSKWQYRRKILTPSFHFNILQDFVEVFNKETDNLVELLKKYSSESNVKVVDPITELTLNSIGETSLGVNMNQQANRKAYKNAIYTFGDYFAYRLLRPWLVNPLIYKLSSTSKNVDNAIKVLHDFSVNIINERKALFDQTSYREKKKVTLLDLLLRAKNNGEIMIDDEGIREEVDTFMFEGHDTTAMALSYLLMALANEASWQEEIYQEIQEILGNNDRHPTFQNLNEMKLMERCIKESLRLYPSVPVISRISDEDFKSTTGFIVPKGTNVNVPIFQMHRSDKLWEDPEKFDPDRFLPENSAGRHPFAFIPFSAGPRNCIGQKYAMLEMKAALCGILRNFVLEPVEKPQDLIFKIDIILRTEKDIKVKFIPRNKP